MKKTIIISYLLVTLITFCGCVFATDFYGGKRPFDYGEAIWVSESPDAWFIVNSYEEDERYYRPKGEIVVGNETIKFALSFDRAVTVRFTDEKGNYMLVGTCKFGPDKLVITVDKEKDTLFNGQYDTITFVREEIAESRPSPKP